MIAMHGDGYGLTYRMLLIIYRAKREVSAAVVQKQAYPFGQTNIYR
jgi:hypothetical protein